MKTSLALLTNQVSLARGQFGRAVWKGSLEGQFGRAVWVVSLVEQVYLVAPKETDVRDVPRGS